MIERPYNPNDLELLISRSLDEALTTDERRQLDAAMAASPELRAEAAGYRALNGLLSRWKADTAGAAGSSIHPSVESAIRAEQGETRERQAVRGATAPQEAADEFSGLNRLLQGYGRAEARVDWEAFIDSVMRQIHPARATAVAPARSRRMMLRLAVPLAAAAALAFAIFGGPWRNGSGEPDIVLNTDNPPTHGIDTPHADDGLPIAPGETRTTVVVAYKRYETVAQVSFGREPSPDWVATAPRRAVGYATVSFAAPEKNADAGPF